MQPPGRISLFFVTATAGSSPAGSSPAGSSPAGSSPTGSSPTGSSPAGLFSGRSACFSRLLTCLSVRRPLLLPAASIPAAGLYPFSAGPLSSDALLCSRGVCFGAGPAGPVFGSFRFPPGPYFVGPSVCRWQRSSCRFSSRGVTGLVIRASHPASSARRRSVSKA